MKKSLVSRLLSVALVLALAGLGYAWWRTEYAWRAGYGDGDMSYFTQADRRALSGGDLTVFHAGFMPFGQSPNNLPWQYEALFEAGDGIFDKSYSAGTGTSAVQEKSGAGTRRRGLGPLYNASGCAACHFRDGRVERPYESGGEMQGIFLRLSVADGRGGWKPPDGYMHQLHDHAVAGVPPEGVGHIDWQEITGAFADGEQYALRRPQFRIDRLAYGALPSNVIIEARCRCTAAACSKRSPTKRCWRWPRRSKAMRTVSAVGPITSPTRRPASACSAAFRSRPTSPICARRLPARRSTTWA